MKQTKEQYGLQMVEMAKSLKDHSVNLIELSIKIQDQKITDPEHPDVIEFHKVATEFAATFKFRIYVNSVVQDLHAAITPILIDTNYFTPEELEQMNVMKAKKTRKKKTDENTSNV